MYETTKITTNNNEKTIINPSDNDFYERLFLVSLSYLDYGRYIFAECAQDATDECFDYELETNGAHFFLDETELQNDNPDEVDIIRAGNNSLALPSQDVNCYEITGEEKQAVIDHCRQQGFSFLS